MSPGELSKAHQDLDTPLRCGACHEFGARRAQLKCLSCHEEIRRMLEQKRGYHGRVVRGGAAQAAADCVRCHSEHNGRNHRLVRWKPSKEKFDHGETGWALEGKHAALRCEQCHNEKRMTAEDRRILKRRDAGSSMLGLSGRCSSCHEDEHHGQLGENCSRCHGLSGWKPAPRFSHDRTAYPLTGLHQRVPCEKCHKPIAALGDYVQYKNFVLHAVCKACHQDPHGGSFAGDCQTCHTTLGWKGGRIGGGFDHARTGFPLAGRHQQVACRQCHKSENFRLRLAHERCADCHQDRHQGQFAHRDGGECRPCHAESGWIPARFGVPEHASTKFPLRGRHEKVECGQCHYAGDARSGSRGSVNYHPESASCKFCHKDVHGGQFAAPPHENRCERCHLETSWLATTYTVREHQQSRYPLHGAHAAVPCAECHKKEGPGRVFRIAQPSCQLCHADPHGRRGEVLAPAGPLRAAAQRGCESCHETQSWRETKSFDHDHTEFPLAGKHRGVTCRGCHKPAMAAGRRQIVFADAPRQCGECHEDPHDGQFRAGAGGAPAQADCARCHTASNWQPTRFDHSLHSSFALDGAHRAVPCRMCHASRQAGGRRVIQYRPTPRRCQECHR